MPQNFVILGFQKLLPVLLQKNRDQKPTHHNEYQKENCHPILSMDLCTGSGHWAGNKITRWGNANGILITGKRHSRL